VPFAGSAALVIFIPPVVVGKGYPAGKAGEEKNGEFLSCLDLKFLVIIF